MEVLDESFAQAFESDLAVAQLRSGVARGDHDSCWQVLGADRREGPIAMLTAWP